MNITTLLRDLASSGITVLVDAGRLKLRGKGVPPAALIERVSAFKDALTDRLAPKPWNASACLDYFNERAAIAEYDGRQPREVAERVAHFYCRQEWSRRNPPPNPGDGQCVHCREAVSGTRSTTLRFGNESRVLHETCRNDFATARKAIATAALSALGVGLGAASAVEVAAGVSPGTAPEAVRPHLTQNSGECEWYTPSEIVEHARRVMGAIDLDPASCETANAVVGATTFYSAADDGLSKPWRGRVWMNPPYTRGVIERFTAKLVREVKDRSVTQAVVLVNNSTATRWFQALLRAAAAHCFPERRIKFWHPDKGGNGPTQGQVIFYFGENVKAFVGEFEKFGRVVVDQKSTPTAGVELQPATTPVFVQRPVGEGHDAFAKV